MGAGAGASCKEVAVACFEAGAGGGALSPISDIVSYQQATPLPSCLDALCINTVYIVGTAIVIKNKQRPKFGHKCVKPCSFLQILS